MNLGKLTTRAGVDHAWSERVTENSCEIAAIALVCQIVLGLRRAQHL